MLTKISCAMVCGRQMISGWEQRAATYARCAAQLLADCTVPGAEAIFDQALSNGLAAIVAAQWGEAAARKSDGRQVKSAAALLSVVEENADAHPKHPGVFVLPDSSPLACPILSGPWARGRRTGLDTWIQVAMLRDGIRATQPSRHASGRGGLESFHVFCLVELDSHESLQRLSGEREKRALRETLEADRRARVLASTVVQRIGPEEAARRAALAHDQHPSDDPYVMTLQDCPVCGYTGLSPDHGDELGMGIGVGQCLVCHYERTPEAAAEEARNRVHELRSADE